MRVVCVREYTREATEEGLEVGRGGLGYCYSVHQRLLKRLGSAYLDGNTSGNVSSAVVESNLRISLVRPPRMT